jgi:hypothetical protein
MQWDSDNIMSTGDQSDMVNRLKRLIPNGWFQEPTPILDAVLNGAAWALSFGYSLISYTYIQTRIRTATDYFLDLASQDYFGANLQRHAGEPDENFRKRILALLLAQRTTRGGLCSTLFKLTGRKPKIFEPLRVADSGAYDTGYACYDVAGAYTELSGYSPYQALIVAYRGNGMSDADIQNWTNMAKPAATVMWLDILNNSVAFSSPLNSQFIGAISCF